MSDTLTINGKPAVKGQQVTDFRGETHTLHDWFNPGTSAGGRGGRVKISNDPFNPLYFPSVIKAEFKEVEETTTTTTTNWKDDNIMNINDKEQIKVNHVLLNARDSHMRIRVFYGDPETGRDWCEEFDTIGYVGKSTGKEPVPLLIPFRNSLGGSPINTEHILKITLSCNPKEVLYQHPNYKKPVTVINSATNSLYINGKLYSTFEPGTENLKRACRLAAFLEGSKNNAYTGN